MWESQNFWILNSMEVRYSFWITEKYTRISHFLLEIIVVNMNYFDYYWANKNARFQFSKLLVVETIFYYNISIETTFNLLLNLFFERNNIIEKLCRSSWNTSRSHKIFPWNNIRKNCFWQCISRTIKNAFHECFSNVLSAFIIITSNWQTSTDNFFLL